jgi:3-hydroxyisobutyrate dehydrogenase
MVTIGFVGIGNMGGPMAANLVGGGHSVRVFDLDAALVAGLVAQGAEAAGSVAEAAAGADAVVTMLPAGKHVAAVYAVDGGILGAADPGALLIDCSTIDVETSRVVHAEATEAGFEMVDAPVSGGVGGATAGTLTFMVGGSEAAFARAEPILSIMGKAVVHVGGPGNGQAAKICNNMILGISMIAVSEAFALGQKLGLKPDRLFEISSQSSGQCWSMTTYCPVPGPVPASPANRDYQAGFTAAMMLKDLVLAQDAAKIANAATPLGSEARALYDKFVAADNGGLDFSGIIKMIEAGG